MSSLLLDLKGLINNSSNTGAISPEELKANQAQIDSSIASIDRIANTTMFEGVKLLNGQLDFVTSGVANSAISDLRLDQVQFGTANAVNVNITQVASAQRGQLFWTAAALASTTSIALTGDKGTQVLTFASTATLSNITDSINAATAVTGVCAVASTTGIQLVSADYGSNQFVKVGVLSGTFDTLTAAGGSAATDGAGKDIQVAVNGVMAQGQGLEVKTNGPIVSMDMTLNKAFNTTGASTSFAITGGGAQFQLGPQINAQQMNILGIQSVASYSLGNSSVGYLRDLMTGNKYDVSQNQQNCTNADSIVDAATQQVAELRARLGAFQKDTLETNMDSLNVTLENVTSSESAIRDADFAQETANMTRSQILVQAGTKVLAMANSAPQSVLTLLG